MVLLIISMIIRARISNSACLKHKRAVKAVAGVNEDARAMKEAAEANEKAQAETQCTRRGINIIV